MPKRLTSAQEEALDLFLDDPVRPPGVVEGVLVAYCGVSRSTAAALVKLKLARWVEEPHTVTRMGLTGRGRYTTEWSIALTTHGKAVNANRAATRRFKGATGG